MKVTELGLQGLKLIELPIFRDNRGFFVERFNVKKFGDLGLPTDFIQDNHSLSSPRVLRGLHFQTSPAQGKLVSVTRGAIWDVAVDVRPKSATFGQHYAVELSADKGNVLWIPKGFAHGFCVIGEEPADVLYKVDALFSPATDLGIRWDDPELNIAWPIKNPILSEKDLKLASFASLKAKTHFAEL